MRGAQGGIVPGDVIQGVDDEAVEDADDLLTALERFQPGDRVTLTVWRAGKVRKLAVTLAELRE